MVRLIWASAARETLTLEPREIVVVVLQFVIASSSAYVHIEQLSKGLTLSPYSGPNLGRPVVGSV